EEAGALPAAERLQGLSGLPAPLGHGLPRPARSAGGNTAGSSRAHLVQGVFRRLPVATPSHVPCKLSAVGKVHSVLVPMFAPTDNTDNGSVLLAEATRRLTTPLQRRGV